MTTLVLILLTGTFIVMAKGILKLEVAFPLTAIMMLILAGPSDAAIVLEKSGGEFIHIAVMFTGVAVPAKLLYHSKALDKFGAYIGERIGTISNRYSFLPFWFVCPAMCLICVFVCAALFHNTTSILVFGPFILLICQNYNIHATPILHGALIASNLGGFSTKWGDTPNIREAMIWGLSHADFFRQITLLNVGFLLILISIVSLLVRHKLKKAVNEKSIDSVFGSFESRLDEKRFGKVRHLIEIDGRKFKIGLAGLSVTVLGSIMFPHYELLTSLGAILFCTSFDRVTDSEETLYALSLSTYFTLLSVFLIAGVLSKSSIGIAHYIESWVASGSIFSIITASYFGTLITEAASWASAAAPIVHAQSPTPQAAWALGAGICAGSSSVLTAATAGVLLAQITTPNKDRQSSKQKNDYQVTFASYFSFGMPISLLMVLYYGIFLYLLW